MMNNQVGTTKIWNILIICFFIFMLVAIIFMLAYYNSDRFNLYVQEKKFSSYIKVKLVSFSLVSLETLLEYDRSTETFKYCYVCDKEDNSKVSKVLVENIDKVNTNIIVPMPCNINLDDKVIPSIMILHKKNSMDITNIATPNYGNIIKFLEKHNAEALKLYQNDINVYVTAADTTYCYMWNPTYGDCTEPMPYTKVDSITSVDDCNSLLAAKTTDWNTVIGERNTCNESLTAKTTAWTTAIGERDAYKDSLAAKTADWNTVIGERNTCNESLTAKSAAWTTAIGERDTCNESLTAKSSELTQVQGELNTCNTGASAANLKFTTLDSKIRTIPLTNSDIEYINTEYDITKENSCKKFVNGMINLDASIPRNTNYAAGFNLSYSNYLNKINVLNKLNGILEQYMRTCPDCQSPVIKDKIQNLLEEYNTNNINIRDKIININKLAYSAPASVNLLEGPTAAEPTPIGESYIVPSAGPKNHSRFLSAMPKMRL